MQLLERAQHSPPLQESQWELPPVGSHGHPPPAAQRRALRWPPPPTGRAAAPATSADRPHRWERVVRRPSRYAGEEELEEAEPLEEEEEEEEGAVAATAVPATSSGGAASPVATPVRGIARLPSRQAESHAHIAVQDLHEMEAAPAPAPGHPPMMLDEYGGGSPFAPVPMQQAPPWLAAKQAGLARSPASQPIGVSAWAGGSAGGDGRPELRWTPATAAAPPPPPHPTTPPAAAGGATLPLLHDSLAQHKLVGPAASALRPPQHGGTPQQAQECWLEAAAAQLPIPQQEHDAAADEMEIEGNGGADAAEQPASLQDVHALLRAMLTPATQQLAH